jgi:hypothetical protein
MGWVSVEGTLAELLLHCNKKLITNVALLR